MRFVQLHIKTDSDYIEIFMAELGEIGFDSFEEESDGLKAYISEEFYEESLVQEIVQRYQTSTQVEHSKSFIEKENWNKLWEQHYDPIDVDGQCIVRASFHEKKDSYPYEIIINPKMSFGTGHHATTWQMIKLLLETDVSGKKVIDLGTGTGILAILAAQKGASLVEATDVDEWCIENSRENFELNNCSHINVYKGSISKLHFDNKYDIVLANINKNVLLDEMAYYSDLLFENGELFLSGFYIDDISDIVSQAAQYNLTFERSIDRDKWVAICLRKS